MGLLKDAIKQAYAEQGTEITWMGNKPKQIQSAAQAKYSDLRKTERNYTKGVHKARKEEII